MNGVSKLLLAGSLVAGVAIGPQVFAQGSSFAPERKMGEAIDSSMKSASFVSSGGVEAAVSKFDVEGGMAMSMWMELEDFGLLTITYSERLGVPLGFIVTSVKPDSPDKAIIITGQGGKIRSFSGVKSRREAEIIYSIASCLPLSVIWDAHVNGRLVESRLSDKEIERLTMLFANEAEHWVQLFDSLFNLAPKATPQKYNRQMESEPLYRSSNYRQSVMGLQKAMRARETPLTNASKPFRIRSRA